MDANALEFFRTLLNKKMEDLLAEAKGTMVDMTDEEDTFPDPTDRATLESDRNFLLRIRDRERKLIVKIKNALERIENGSFGICEVCGEDDRDMNRCDMCYAYVCNECCSDGVCLTCQEASCHICGEYLSSRACNICGRLVCEDHGIKEAEATTCEICQADVR